MDNCGAGSQGLEVRTQEKSIITLTNGGGGDFKPKVEKKKRKQEREKDDARGTKQCFFNGVHQ